MGSRGNPNSWAPYGTYKDCSAGICSIYCPQWCYIIFPPPPPFIPDDDSGTNFSPLIIAVIGILASAFLLIAYYTVVSKYCRRRGGDGGGDHPDHPVPELEPNRSHMHHDQWQAAASGGLDQVLIESIAVCQYKRGDGLVEGTECAVCLSEFEDNEKIRLLPKCSHAFHLPCIDTWLKSHSNCPLCRASVVPGNHHPLPPTPPPPPPATLEESSTLDISSLRVQTQSNLVLMVEDPEWGQRTEVVVEDGVQEGLDKFKRSNSLGSTPCRGNLLVSDILQICEDDEEREMRIHQEIGSSRGIRRENSMPNGGNEGFDLVTRSPVARHEKGKSSVIPN